MREKWRTQEEYDKFKENGGTRLEYVEYSKSIKKLQKKIVIFLIEITFFFFKCPLRAGITRFIKYHFELASLTFFIKYKTFELHNQYII